MASPRRRTIKDAVAVFQGESPIIDSQYFNSDRPTPGGAVVPLLSQIRAIAPDGSVFQNISNGVTLNLSSLPDPFNIEAVSSDAANTGSVQFVLTHAQSGEIFNRVETNPIYTMQIQGQEVELANGDYALVVTPYSAAGASGDAGTSLTVSFTVNDDRANPVLSAVINATTLGSCYVVDNIACVANSTLAAAVSNASGTVTYQWSVSNSDIQIVGANNQATVNLQSSALVNQSATVTLLVSDGTATATSTFNLVHSHGVIGSGGDGFTSITPAQDSNVIYVSSLTGSDDNDGLSEGAPKLTLGAAFANMRAGFSDHVLLEAGSYFDDVSLLGRLRSGRSQTEPSVLGMYGVGARPIIARSSGNNDFWRATSGSLDNVLIQSMHFMANKLVVGRPEFTGDEADDAKFTILGSSDNVTFEDNIFDHVEVIAQGYNGGIATNLTLRRNISTGAYFNRSSQEGNGSIRPSNFFFHSVDGLTIEENVAYRGGWNPDVLNAGANQFNHNYYIQHNCNGDAIMFRRNFVLDGSSHGSHGRCGGRYFDNFYARNTVNLQLGYRGYPLPNGRIAYAHDNVITEVGHMVKGQNACDGSNLCTSASWGLHLDDLGGGDVQVYRNIVAGVSPRPQSLYPSLNRVGIKSVAGVDYQGNDVWHVDSETQGDDQGYSNPGRTLAGWYAATIGGNEDHDEAANYLLSRPAKTWNANYNANTVNNYVRAGYNKPAVSL